MDYRQGAEGFNMNQDTAVTLGKFDGFHSGHRELMKKIMAQPGLSSVVFQLTGSRDRAQILTAAEGRQVAARIGISCLIDCPLVPQVAGMAPEQFVREILVKQLRAKYIAVGADFRFGYQRQGDFRLLQQLQESCGFTVEVVQKKQYGGRDVSSTYIREMLWQGDMETVNRLLGYPFFMLGQAPADRPGYLAVPAAKLLPPTGYYTAQIKAGDEVFTGITKIRQQASDGQAFRGAEAHLSDADRPLAGPVSEISVFSRLTKREKGNFSE